MELYQITEITEKLNNAGTKANADIAKVADTMGFKAVPVRMATMQHSAYGKVIRQAGYYRDWKKATKSIPAGSTLLLQHPFHHKQLTREACLRELKKKDVKIISFVHDVEKLRKFRYSGYYKKEFQIMLEIADVLIVHNEVMKRWFLGRSIPEEKLVTLGIFDYLRDTVPGKKVFKKSLALAGNLDTTKCGYIAKLGKISGIRFNLYGAGFDGSLLKYNNITYHGEFPVDVIPEKMTEGFGLVWDGNSIDGCRGDAGQYLRYNNPHKLSLYLSSGLPAVIWSGAAEAEFVRENNVGICVDRIEDMVSILETMTEADYDRLCDNVNHISEDLRKGTHTEKALNQALHRIGVLL